MHIEGALETALDADMTLCAQAETLPLSSTSPMPATGETFPEWHPDSKHKAQLLLEEGWAFL